MSDHMSAQAYKELMDTKVPGDLGPFDDGSPVKSSLKAINKMIRKQEEDDLTKQVTEYLEVLKLQGKVKLFSHVPQETYTKSWATKHKNTAMGVRAGVPDMIIVFTGGVLFLELKKLRGGRKTAAQDQWLQAIGQIYSYAPSSVRVSADIAQGWDEAEAIINYYATQWQNLEQ